MEQKAPLADTSVFGAGKPSPQTPASSGALVDNSRAPNQGQESTTNVSPENEADRAEENTGFVLRTQ
jgi:hypothetical protein